MKLEQAVDLVNCPIHDADYVAQCKAQLDASGSLLIHDFIRPEIIAELRAEAEAHEHLAYYCVQTHTAYLAAPDPQYPDGHPRNRQLVSTKGCITDDQVPPDSWLRVIYDDPDFRAFLCAVLDETDCLLYTSDAADE